MENSSPLTYSNNSQSIFAALRDVLADLYPEENAARVVVADAGLDAKQIPFSSRAQTNWHNILAEAIRQARLDPLLKIALADYAANPVLLAAFEQYRLLIEQGGNLEAPASLPANAGVTIAGDVNLNQGDFVGRDKNVRSITVGRDVIGGLLITGDHNQVFVGGYERLQDAYINPQSVFDRVDLAHFIGREWLLAEVDAFLQNHDRGYFILEANAGLGKTAFMAWLVKQRNYIHHFCELTPGLEGTAHALKSLATQLALAYQLRPDGVLPSAASRPDFLYELLVQAAQRLHPGEKIVVVVDALDEAGTLGNQNVLGLPTGLPEGVFFVVSQRPATSPLMIKDAKTIRHYFRVTAESDENQADMRRFLASTSTLPEISQALQASEYHFTAAEFIETLLVKCRGVWIYLYFVVQEIRRGKRSPLDLDALPDGMTHYYAQYWQRWRVQTNDNEPTINPKWYQIYRPLLTMLAAAQEAVTLEQLLEWTKINEPVDLLRWYFEEQWCPFLIVTEQEQKRYYRLYHATLREFFAGSIEQNPLSAQPSIMKELSEATRDAHSCLVDRYLASWGGIKDGLPGLQAYERRDLDNQYGLRHLAAHMEAAERIGELHNLLRAEWVRRAEVPYWRQGWCGWLDKLLGRQPTRQRIWYQNVWYTVRESVGQTAGYLADIQRAWQLAEHQNLDESKPTSAGTKEKVAAGQLNERVGLQCRYALMVASLNSHAHNIGPGLLVELVQKGIWLPTQGLAYARQVPDKRQRVKILVALAPFLSDQGEQQSVFQEALAVARTIQNALDRVLALDSLVPHLTLGEQQSMFQEVLAMVRSMGDGFFDRRLALHILAPHLAIEQVQEALVIAYTIEDSSNRAWPLASLARRLVELGAPEQALAVARTIEDNSDRADALDTLASYLTLGGQRSVLQEELAVARDIENGRARAAALVNLALHLPSVEQRSIRQEAMAVVRMIKDSSDRAAALANLIPHLALQEQQSVLQEALAVVRMIKDSSDHVAALTELIQHLTPGEQRSVLQEALVVARTIEDNSDRSHALTNLAPYLTIEQMEEALGVAHTIEDNSDRSHALTNLAPRLAELGATAQALAVVRMIGNNSNRADALDKVAPYLAIEQIQDALAMTRIIDDNADRNRALASLAPRLAKLGAIPQGLAIAHTIKESYYWTDALANLIPHLAQEEQWSVLKNALAVARTIEDSFDQTDTLINLAPHLTIEQIEEAVEVARAIRDISDRDRALASLAPRLAELGATAQGLALAHTIKDSYYQADALDNLALHLAQEEQRSILQEALAVACTIDDSINRDLTLAYLAIHFAELGDTVQALEVVYTIEDSYYRDYAVVTFAPHLTPREQRSVLQGVLAEVRAKDNSDPTAALSSLAPQVALGEAGGALQEALEVARNIKYNYGRGRILVNLAPLVLGEPGSVLQEALEVARSLQYGPYQAWALATLAPYLTIEQIYVALTVTHTMVGAGSSQKNALSKLILRLAELDTLEQALVVACDIAGSYDRAHVLATLAPHLTKLSQIDLYQLWCEILPILSSRTRADLLSDLAELADVIVCLGGAEAIVETAQAIQDVGRWWP